MNEPAPRRKHTERQVGETYPDALSRVAGERDATLHDAARLRAQVAAVRALHHVTLIQTTGGPREMCDHCYTGDPFCTVSNDWPCPTVAALDAAVPGPAGEKP